MQFHPRGFDTDRNAFIYDGCGLNLQTSYLFNGKWEIALRNSTLFPDSRVQQLAGYRNWNQTTIGVMKSTTYYADAVLWAVKENITKGTTSTTFSPNADCTRAQIVTFLWRCKK